MNQSNITLLLFGLFITKRPKELPLELPVASSFKEDATGSFGFGGSFLSTTAEGALDRSPLTCSLTPPSSPKTTTVGKHSENLFDVQPYDEMDHLSEQAIKSMKYCKICNISVVSTKHMSLHLEGSKHAKNLRQLGLEKE